MTAPHVVCAGAAVLAVVTIVATAMTCARRVETLHVHSLAPQMFAQKSQGSALQRAAFRQHDLLPVYGSSELITPNPYHASTLFRDYPTGFTIFPLGRLGSTSLIWLQALAAVGPDLRGRKVAVSLSGRLFMTEMVDRPSYAANFSALHAGDLAFSSHLSFAVKQGAARRILEYPATLAREPLLAFALAQLADGSWSSRLLYYATVPLGKLQNLVRHLQDDLETSTFVRAQVGLAPVRRRGTVLDWTEMTSRAREAARRMGDNNPFGFENSFWTSHAAEISAQKGLYASAATRETVERSAEWTDLELLLQVIRELGGEPLILDVPMNGPYYDYLGISPAIRGLHYGRLRELAKKYGARVIDFGAQDADTYFTGDPAPHLSSSGWVPYARALDAFFHGRGANDS